MQECRIIRDPDEALALPAESVIRDRHGFVFERAHAWQAGWWMVMGRGDWDEEIAFPVVVLWEP